MPFQLPVRRLLAEQIPAEHRKWVELALLGPLNRVLTLLETTLTRLSTSQINVQVLEWKGPSISATSPAEFTSTLYGKCAGLWVGYAAILDAGGVAATALAGLPLPGWVEVATQDRGANKLRITTQGGLTGGSRYAVRWIAVGSA